MKLLSRAGVVLEQITWLKLRTVPFGEAVHFGHKLVDTHLINISERPTSERGESGSKHESNVPNYGILNDIILQAFDCFIDEPDLWWEVSTVTIHSTPTYRLLHSPGDNTVLNILFVQAQISLNEWL